MDFHLHPGPTRKGLTIAAAVGAFAVVAGVSRRRTIARWAAAPDPLAGRTPRFPAGEVIEVATNDGARIHTVTAGAGPRLVLIHGLTSSIADLGPIADRLVGDGFSVTGVDQRGHGGSTVGSEGFGTRQHAADLAAVLVELEIDDAVLVGHSMGGMAALTIAAVNPDDAMGRVSGLVPLAAPTSLSAGWQQAILKTAVVPIPAWLTDRPNRLRLVAGLVAFGPNPSLFMVDSALASFRRCSEATRQGATLGLLDYDVTDELQQIDLPVLVVTGRADHMVPASNSGTVVRLSPNAQGADHRGAGHMLIWERADEVASEIAAFARSVQSSC